MLTPDEVREQSSKWFGGDGFHKQLAKDYLRALRILAVERGDESQAPEGWRVTSTGWQKRIGRRKWWDLKSRPWARKWRWMLRKDDDGYIGEGKPYHTALEAMEAADEALKSVGNGGAS